MYAKDYVDFLVTNADQLMIAREREHSDQLSSHQNQSTVLQGQIDLIRSHQVVQDRRINYALAREAEDADARLNERFVWFVFRFVLYWFFVFLCLSFFYFQVSVATVFNLAFRILFYRKLNCIVLKQVGRIGGDDRQVKSRLRHILSCISKEEAIVITEVKVYGSTGPRPPIYEVHLDNSETAESLRVAFARFTRKRNPVRCPPELDGVDVYNSVTLATRVRISILRVGLISSFFFNSLFFVLYRSFC